MTFSATGNQYFDFSRRELQRAWEIFTMSIFFIKWFTKRKATHDLKFLYTQSPRSTVTGARKAFGRTNRWTTEMWARY